MKTSRKETDPLASVLDQITNKSLTFELETFYKAGLEQNRISLWSESHGSCLFQILILLRFELRSSFHGFDLMG